MKRFSLPDEKLCVDICGEDIFLLSDKALLWPRKNTLVLSDLHIGKAGYFQNNGIPLPTESIYKDLRQLDQLINVYKPDSVIVVGDMFHNKKNAGWEPFERWRSQNSDVSMILVMGNHEILPKQYYQVLDLYTTEYLCEFPFIFIHNTINQYNLFNNYFRVGGHLHPAVKLQGKGRQRHVLPCFYKTDDFLLLPAFGSLTGNYLVEPKDNEKAYVIVENRVLPV